MLNTPIQSRNHIAGTTGPEIIKHLQFQQLGSGSYALILKGEIAPYIRTGAVAGYDASHMGTVPPIVIGLVRPRANREIFLYQNLVVQVRVLIDP